MNNHHSCIKCMYRAAACKWYAVHVCVKYEYFAPGGCLPCHLSAKKPVDPVGPFTAMASWRCGAHPVRSQIAPKRLSSANLFQLAHVETCTLFPEQLDVRQLRAVRAGIVLDKDY